MRCGDTRFLRANGATMKRPRSDERCAMRENRFSAVVALAQGVL